VVTSAFDATARAFLARHRVARLATADAAGVPHVVPVCYAVSGGRIYFVVDDKPKHPGGRALKRMRNIAENPEVALVADDWSENWSRLAFLLVRGPAAIVADARERRRALRALRVRYPQYRVMALDGPDHPVVGITPVRVHLWRAAASAPPRRTGRITPRSDAARSRPHAASPGRPKTPPRQSRGRRRPTRARSRRAR
jgi:coenzyme F420-0:L-glutamate ligase/coenzyme F420-1:gamma-L-glutamate ligase